MCYTIQVWINNDIGREVWLIKIPKKARGIFESEILPLLKYVGIGDHYRKWMSKGYGGYYINSPTDQNTIANGNLTLGYKIHFVNKEYHKELNK